jgi:plastocyanin
MKSHIFAVSFAAVLIAVFLPSRPVTSAPADASTIQGQVTAQGLKSAGSIAVYIDSIPGKDFKPPDKHAVVDQKKLTFVPHVIAILKGTTVDFLNSDPVGHNVYWPSISGNKKLAHNLGTWPQGQTKSFTFNDLGTVPLLCNVHTQMSGYVIVVPTPYFAVTDDQGKFAIKDVPPGHYMLKAWSEEGKPVSQEIDVTGAVTNVNLTVHR